MTVKVRLSLTLEQIEIILEHLGWIDSWNCGDDEAKYAHDPGKEKIRKHLFNKFAAILDWSPE